MLLVVLAACSPLVHGAASEEDVRQSIAEMSSNRLETILTETGVSFTPGAFTNAGLQALLWQCLQLEKTGGSRKPWHGTARIPDPSAVRPEDWSDEDDGEWEPDLILAIVPAPLPPSACNSNSYTIQGLGTRDPEEVREELGLMDTKEMDYLLMKAGVRYTPGSLGVDELRALLWQCIQMGCTEQACQVRTNTIGKSKPLERQMLTVNYDACLGVSMQGKSMPRAMHPQLVCV